MKISTKSTWQADYKPQKFPKLTQNLQTDVAIIGGGMVGILSAYMLAKAGKSVVIIESKKVLSGATSLTTAFLTQIYDTSLADSIRIYGAKNTKLIWQSHGEAIDLIETIIKTEKIECEFMRCSNFNYANTDEDYESLQSEYDAMQKLGFDAELKRKNSLNFRNSGFVETKQQAKFHPIKFLQGVVNVLQEMGVEIYEQSTVDKVTGTGPVKVHVGEHIVKAQYAIIATYDPLNNPKETFAKKGMYV